MKFYILFLVTRNAKKAKKNEADQNPEHETPETDSEKEEGATSTSTSDTEDEEEEAKAINTTSVKHNTKSITTRYVKNFYTNFINNHKYIFLKNKKKFIFIFTIFIFISRTDVNSRKRKVPPPQPNNLLTSAKKNTVKRSRKKDRPSVFMTNDNFVPTASNQVVIKRADEVKNIQDFRLFFNEDKTRCVSFMNNTFKGLFFSFPNTI